MNKSFYWSRNSKILDDPYFNPTFHELLCKSQEDLEKWITETRARIAQVWDEDGLPPLAGKNEKELIEAFNNLSNFDTSSFQKVDELTGKANVIDTPSYMGSVASQFFPTMMKAKINYTLDGNGYAVYDLFKDDRFKNRILLGFKRHFRRDSFYRYSVSITKDSDSGLINAVDGKDWVTKFREFPNIFKGYNFWLSEVELPEDGESEVGSGYTSTDASKFLFLTGEQLKSDEVQKLLKPHNLANIPEIKEGYKYPIRLYRVDSRIFPVGFTAFKIGYIQVAVNFPSLVAKFLYEKYTDHIKKQKEPINIYDPSSGWGGRILGAMSVKPDRKIHYIGTDPNTDNFIPELGITRYEYMAKMFQEKTYRGRSPFISSNTFQVFQSGSECIAELPDFQKYKGKLDMVFTSPPYFSKERYSEDETQSCIKFSTYDDWRDNFLYPTLKTCYEYLKNDRYLLWNIADVNYGTKITLPLEDDSIRICKELGFEFRDKEHLALCNMPGANRVSIDGSPTSKNFVKMKGAWRKTEPIFVFYKP